MEGDVMRSVPLTRDIGERMPNESLVGVWMETGWPDSKWFLSKGGVLELAYWKTSFAQTTLYELLWKADRYGDFQ